MNRLTRNKVAFNSLVTKLRGIEEGLYVDLGIEKMSQIQIANKCDIPKQQINSYINGLSTPNMAALIKLSEGLGVSIDFLVKGEVQEADLLYEKIVKNTGLMSKSIEKLKHLKKVDLKRFKIVAKTLNILISRLSHFGNSTYYSEDVLGAIAEYLQITDLNNNKYIVDNEFLNNIIEQFEDVENLDDIPRTIDNLKDRIERDMSLQDNSKIEAINLMEIQQKLITLKDRVNRVALKEWASLIPEDE